MRRSGVNKAVVTEERLVLPRLDDVAEDVKELLELGGDVNFAVVDVKDAFHTLRALPSERKYQA
eukprot:4387179-Amphidinium_carterae.1